MNWRNGVRMAIVVAALVFAPSAPAQTDAVPATTGAPATPAAVVPAPRYAPATLTVFNRPVFTFRYALFGIPPDERAMIAREHIYAILARGEDDTVSVETLNQGRIIKIGPRAAFAIAREDAPPGSEEVLDAAAASAAAALERAIGETRESRDGALMLRSIIHSAIATAVLVIVLWLLVVAGRWITRRVLRLADETSERLKVGGVVMVQRQRAVRIVHTLLRVAGLGLILLAVYEWLGFVLGRFPYTRVWAEHLNSFLLGTLADMLVAIARAIPELFVAVVIFVIARGADRMQRTFFDGVQAGRVHVAWVDKDTAAATRRISTIAIWLFAVVMAYPYIPGSSTDAFKGLSVLLGLMVSVGASGTVGQAVAGLILLYTHAFRPGDYVRVGDAEGTVIAMGVFTSRVRTGMGEEITIPNATVLSATSRNFSRGGAGPGFMLEVNVTIGYDVAWRQVKGLLMAAARATAGIAPTPEPRVLLIALSDFYVEYRLVCYARPAGAQQRADVISALNEAVLDSFNEHGVQIMSPHYYMDPATEKVVPRERWYPPPAAPPSG